MLLFSVHARCKESRKAQELLQRLVSSFYETISIAKRWQTGRATCE